MSFQRTFDRLLTRHVKEGISSKIELKDEDPDLVQLAMHFFYTAQYDPKDRNSKPHKSRKRLISETVSDPSELCTNMEMFFLADMLLSDRLKNFTISQIEKCFVNPAPADLDTILEMVYDRTDPTGLPFFLPLIKFCSHNLEALYGEFAGEGIKKMQPDFFLQVMRCCHDSQKENRKESENWDKQAVDEQAKLKRLEKELSIYEARWSSTKRLCSTHIRCHECDGEGSLQLGLVPNSEQLPRIACDHCSWSCWSNR